MKRHHVNRIFALSIVVGVLLVVGFWIYNTEAKNEPRDVEVEIGDDDDDDAEAGEGITAHIRRFVVARPVRLTRQMVVDLDTGNVGIGKIDPEAKLDILGDVSILTNGAEDEFIDLLDGRDLQPQLLQILAGSQSTGITSAAPIMRAQVHSSVNTNPNEYAAAYDYQTFLNPDHDKFYAGIFHELRDRAPGKGDHVGIASHVHADANRAPGGSTGGDNWAYWGFVANNGHDTNGIVAEFNPVNSHSNYHDDAPDGVPQKLMYGIQLLPDTSQFHVTRAVSILPDGDIGWSTGMTNTGFVDTGIYLNSSIPYRDPPFNSITAPKVGIRFGKDLTHLIRVQRGNEEVWGLNAEGDFLVFRDHSDPDYWWMAMDKLTNTLEFNSGTVLITEDGRVSIGGDPQPNNILTIVQNSTTDPIADAWTTYSSKRWKTNIKTIDGALDKVQRLHGVEYDWKADGKHDIGLIAEEVGEVIPEVVAYEENGVDAQSVDYARLVALLIEGMKEQQKQIEAQQKEIATLKMENAELTTLKAKMAQFSSSLQRLEALVAVEKNVDITVIESE